MGTLESALLSLWVGIRVVLVVKAPLDYCVLRVPSFLRVFAPEWHRVNRPCLLSPSNPFSSLSTSVPALKTQSTNAQKLLRHLKGTLTKTVICGIYIYCAQTHTKTHVCVCVCFYICVFVLCFFNSISISHC